MPNRPLFFPRISIRMVVWTFVALAVVHIGVCETISRMNKADKAEITEFITHRKDFAGNLQLSEPNNVFGSPAKTAIAYYLTFRADQMSPLLYVANYKTKSGLACKLFIINTEPPKIIGKRLALSI